MSSVGEKVHPLQFLEGDGDTGSNNVHGGGREDMMNSTFYSVCSNQKTKSQTEKDPES